MPLTGGHFRQQHVLGWLYLIRSATIAEFVFLPQILASVVALTWLGTVSLTSGRVAKLFGTRHIGTLFGLCFLSYQVGSFLGAWRGGLVFDLTGSYHLVWVATTLAGPVVAALHFPIDNTPIGARLPGAPANASP